MKQLNIFTDNYKITEVGLEVTGKPDFEDWMDYGKTLKTLEGTARQFAIGDWIVAGFDTYEHGKWDAVQQVWGEDIGLLQQYEYVSKRLKSLIRIKDLSWSHHRQVADLPEDKQRYWLKKAVDNKLSVAKLQAAMKSENFEVVPGRMWQLGSHRLMCGDIYNKDHYAKLVGTTPIDALITDPPYGIDYQPDWKKWDGSKSDFSSIEGDDRPFSPEPFLDYPTVVLFGANNFSDKLPVGGWVVWDKRLDEDKDGMFGSPFELAWFKSENTNKNAIMVRVLHGGVVNADSEIGNNEKRFHPTQKPIQVMEKIINQTTKLSQVVLDPFGGSGSTLLACEKVGRYCLSMEIDPDYVATILSRWVNKYGVQPEVIGE